MRTPVPVDLLAKLERDYPEYVPLIAQALDTPPSVSLRLNSYRILTHRPHSELLDQEIPWLPCPFVGYWLSERPIFALDPMWHAGAYYVQDASAMALATLWDKLRLDHIDLAVDLCAAPGGKSTLLRSLLPDTTLLVSNEILPKRSRILVENMVKWCGADQTIIMQEDPEHLSPLLAGQCGLILVDAPCSGDGLMRRDENARRMWSPRLVEICVVRQQNILREACKMLAPDGILLYATCTLNQEENDQIVQWLLANYPFELIDLSSVSSRIPGAYATTYGLHLWPGIVRGEGQYIAAMRLTDRLERTTVTHKVKSLPWTSYQDLVNLPWLERSPFDDYYAIGDCIYQLSSRAVQLLSQAYYLHLSISIPGLAVADMRDQRKGYAPSFAWIHHPRFSSEHIPTFELSYGDALHYLRGEALVLEGISANRGVMLVTYQGQPLGLSHNVGSRLNNLYPKPYRLRI